MSQIMDSKLNSTQMLQQPIFFLSCGKIETVAAADYRQVNGLKPEVKNFLKIL